MIFSEFIEDKAILNDNNPQLTLGSKIEHADYIRMELQPNACIMRMPDTKHTVWAAVSRAVRIPAFGEQAGIISTYIIHKSGIPAFMEHIGNPGFISGVPYNKRLPFRALYPLSTLQAFPKKEHLRLQLPLLWC